MVESQGKTEARLVIADHRVLPKDTRFDWFWVGILGLPLQLWSKEVMKMIGRVCGGLLENEEEKKLKNHLKWARITVRGPKEKIPSLIVSDGGLICKLSVWVEAPVTYRRKEVDDSPSRGVSIAAKIEKANIVVLGRSNLSLYGKGKDTKKNLQSDDNWELIVSALGRKTKPSPLWSMLTETFTN
uniref:Uncharacterized protein n=1 Tax=Solanum lycopersicum TaxID=4081 RepID=A0A3Q7IDA7_SOLLC